MNNTQSLVIVTGPTGVGKTDFIHTMAKQLPIEVINGDMGQMYEPLTIGTAKPDWRHASVSHHLFDSIRQPLDFSAMKYRERVKSIIKAIWDRGNLPVIVGGSSFYLLALFFPITTASKKSDRSDSEEGEGWQLLQRIDPERAKAVDAHDTYRVQRALAIWKATGKEPSRFKPPFEPIASHITLVWLERDRAELYARINERVDTMMQAGWLEEVRYLVNTPWEPFLKKKKLIGYETLFSYIEGSISREHLYEQIRKKTRNYAKRQITFWRSFKRKLISAYAIGTKATTQTVNIHELYLTHNDIGSYIKQLKKICEYN